MKTSLTAAVVAVIGAGVLPAAGAARPCGEHVGKDRQACLKQYKRDKMDWPPNPTAAEVQRRVGSYNWHKAKRVAICETGMRLDWYPSGTYRGPLGMYRTTQDYGKRATGYWSPRTWQEHVAIAVAAHPITGGWSGWGCGSA